ncbi:UTRA domain-containing protein [Streptomyces chartreusis]|uniref:Transcriptional GntR family regulator n=1 Tax=Streptomyces sp. F11 TaxID=319318 RepID=V9QGB0_9ACTN|nr:UTRA domain-containing protein [Streptomyces sp. F11]AHC28145.1 transcriptional GntR family regulator [Streptomyces sp. F11]
MPSNTIGADGTITRDARSRYVQRAEGGAHGAFEAETKRAGGSPRAEVEVQRGTAPADVADLLGVSPDAEVVIRQRRMYDGDRLVQLADTYIPAFVAEAAPAVAQLDTGAGGIISRMADAGLAQTDVVEDVTQVPATAAQAEALGVDSGELLLTITHTGRTEDGRTVEVTRHVLSRGWTLRYGVPLD